MPADFAAYVNVAREVWTPDALMSQLIEETPTLGALGVTDKYNVGALAKTPVKTGHGAGFRAVGDNEDASNPATSAGIKQAQWNYKHFGVDVKVLHQADVATSNQKVAVVSAVTSEVEDATQQMAQQIERMLFSPGDGFISGVTTGNSTTVTLDTVRGPIAIANGWLYEGAVIDVGTVGASDVISGAGTPRTITSISGNTVVVSGAALNVTGGTHFVSWAGSVIGATNREMTSLPQIIDQTAILGTVNPATVSKWKGSFADSTVTSLLLANVTNSRTKIRRSSGETPDLFICGPEQAEALYNQLQLQVRFDQDKVDFGAVKGVSFMGQALVEDPRCPVSQFYALTSKYIFFVGAQAKPSWLNPREPLVWLGGWSLQGKLVYDINLATSKRNAQGGYLTLT